MNNLITTLRNNRRIQTHAISTTMKQMNLLIVLVLAVLQLSQAFTSPLFVPSRTTTSTSQSTLIGTRLYGFGDEKEGGAAIAKPKVGSKTATEVKTRQKVEIKKTIKPAEPVQRREEEFEEAPMYKLMLIGDDSYDATHVVERLCAICDDMDEDQAATVFQQANQEGKAMCGKYPFERAELFKEQLQRSDPMIFSDMEEENA